MTAVGVETTGGTETPRRGRWAAEEGFHKLRDRCKNRGDAACDPLDNVADQFARVIAGDVRGGWCYRLNHGISPFHSF